MMNTLKRKVQTVAHSGSDVSSSIDQKRGSGLLDDNPNVTESDVSNEASKEVSHRSRVTSLPSILEFKDESISRKF